MVELFDADTDVGVADVVQQGGELRFADASAALLQATYHLRQSPLQDVETAQGGL